MLKYKCLMEKKKEIDFGNHLVKNIVIICDLYKIAKIK